GVPASKPANFYKYEFCSSGERGLLQGLWKTSAADTSRWHCIESLGSLSIKRALLESIAGHSQIIVPSVNRTPKTPLCARQYRNFFADPTCCGIIPAAPVTKYSRSGGRVL